MKKKKTEREQLSRDRKTASANARKMEIDKNRFELRPPKIPSPAGTDTDNRAEAAAISTQTLKKTRKKATTDIDDPFKISTRTPRSPPKKGGRGIKTYNDPIDYNFIPYNINNRIIYEYFDDPNELCKRLRLLVSSRMAGNTNHMQEINSIIEELRELKCIV